MRKEKNGDIWNELQPYFCNNLSLSFSKYFFNKGDYYFFEVAKNVIEKGNISENNKKFLHLCLKIYVSDLILEQKYG